MQRTTCFVFCPAQAIHQQHFVLKHESNRYLEVVKDDRNVLVVNTKGRCCGSGPHPPVRVRGLSREGVLHIPSVS